LHGRYGQITGARWISGSARNRSFSARASATSSTGSSPSWACARWAPATSSSTTCSSRTSTIVQVVSAPDDYYVEVPAAFIQLEPGTAATEEEIIAFCVGKIATFRVPRYVRFITEWPMSGTKIKKAILRDLIAADLKEQGITRAPRIETSPSTR
jgi:acyl-CoA synthetase (AMP-forming)/AMP-acid ligase II